MVDPLLTDPQCLKMLKFSLLKLIHTSLSTGISHKFLPDVLFHIKKMESYSREQK